MNYEVDDTIQILVLREHVRGFNERIEVNAKK